ncbi:hypothetical protein [Azospirillum melinis]|uniref:hypothetical protein n=1 Tax=Azospirillum melinis TaxID=328839 RepID=UPI00157B79FC|nr:hypothetical protein [Azospirillum melinis]MBP2305870.1 hypothetical protein [Azospirillum melinis]
MRDLHGWAGRLVEEWECDAAPVAAADGMVGDGMAGRLGRRRAGQARQGTDPSLI